MKQIIAALLIGSLLCTAAFGQHDMQRNSARLIAGGRIERAVRNLQKKPGRPESLFLLAVAECRREPPDAGKALEYARRAVDAGLPFGRLLAGPREALAPLYALDEFQDWAKRAGPALLHGPQLGSVTDSSARLWVRTAPEAKVRIAVRPKNAEGNQTVHSDVAQTSADHDYTGICRIGGLSPDTAYVYTVEVDGDTVTEPATFRTYPREHAPAEFTVGFGGGAGYIPRRERMWTVIAEHRPLAFLMLGDNVYIDDPKHPFTQRYCYYRRQSRPEWRHLAARTALYAIYDDHDFGTNDCVPGPHLDRPAWKREVWRVFRQNWNNPTYAGGEDQPGCRHDFYIADVHFIMLDCRYYRDLKGGTMIGPAQKKWLFRTLKGSRGTFKVIASSVPFAPGVKPGSRDPWDGFPEERSQIFAFLAENDIEGVVLISADRHRSDIRRIEREGAYDLIEFESSKLTNRHTHRVVKTPGLIFGYNKRPSFGLLHFDTSADDPTVTYEIRNIEDQKIHSFDLPLSRLRKP